jgi:hypothetical protein
MEGHEDDAAVRVEIESSPLSSSSLLGAQRQVSDGRPRRNRSERRILTAGVVVAALSIVSLSLLRPEPGQAADGTQRQATTTIPTSTPSTTNSTDGLPSTTAATVPFVNVAVSDLTQAVSGVVPWQDGYLALAQRSEELLLFSSPDGVSWTPVETRLDTVGLPEIGVDTDSRAQLRVYFEALGVAGDGLAVSLVQVSGDANELLAQRTMITRLSSQDGKVWHADPEFDVMDIAQALVMPVVNTADLTTVAVFLGSGNPLIEQVVAANVVDPDIRDGCWRRAMQDGLPDGDQSVRLWPCDLSDPVSLSTAQLRTPAAAAAIGACLEDLNSRSGPPIDIYSQRRNEPTIYRYLEQGTIGALPIGTPDGNLAILDPGRSLSTSQNCQLLDGVDPLAPVDHGVVLLEPGGGSIRMTSGDALPPVELFELPSSIAATNDSILVPAGDQMFSVDLAGGEWTAIARAVRPTELVWAAPNGERLFTFDGSTMNIAVPGSEWRQVSLDRSLTPLRILLADEERLLLIDRLGVSLSIAIPTAS